MFRDHDRCVHADLRRELLRAADPSGLQLDDRVLEHRLVEFKADLLDMSGLLVAQQVAGAADVEIVAGELEARTEAIQVCEYLKTLLSGFGDRTIGGHCEIGVSAGL